MVAAKLEVEFCGFVAFSKRRLVLGLFYRFGGMEEKLHCCNVFGRSLRCLIYLVIYRAFALS
jgi:hypothetical protein